MKAQVTVWARELGICRALLEKTNDEPSDVIADEVHCLAGRLEEIARDMRRAVDGVDRYRKGEEG